MAHGKNLVSAFSRYPEPNKKKARTWTHNNISRGKYLSLNIFKKI
jgi:hypothetical protein